MKVCILPAGAKVISIKLSEDPPDNIQVTDVDLIRQAVSGRERITPTARIARNGGVDAREVDVSLELDGQEIQTRAVTLDANGATSVTFQPFTVHSLTLEAQFAFLLTSLPLMT